MIRRVVGIHFSPAGGTADMTDRLTDQLADIFRNCSPEMITTETYELLRLGDEAVDFDDETVAVIGMPVYVGKVPLPALYALKKIRANGSVAVAVVSYGARTYGNALYELQHHAEEQGFKVIGAGAFSVKYKRHGLRSVPGEYSGDRESVEQFGKAAAAKIRRLGGCEIEGLRIKKLQAGSRSTRSAGSRRGLPLPPRSCSKESQSGTENPSGSSRNCLRSASVPEGRLHINSQDIQAVRFRTAFTLPGS